MSGQMFFSLLLVFNIRVRERTYGEDADAGQIRGCEEDAEREQTDDLTIGEGRPDFIHKQGKQAT